MNIFEKTVKENKSPLSMFKFIIGKDEADKSLINLANYIDNLDKENDRLQNLVNTWNKDEKIQKLEKELYSPRRKEHRKSDFAISEEELAACGEWEDTHLEEKHKNQGSGTIGGRFTYCLTPTSIGVCGKVKCSCGDSFEFRELG